MDALEARTVLTTCLRAYVCDNHSTADVIANVLSVQDAAWADMVLDTCWALDWEREALPESVDALPLSTVRTRVADVLARLLTASVLTREKVCTRLDAPLLQALGLVDPTIFHRRGIQIRTASFFKQHKYNLLREENEGYASLLTELMTHLGPPLVATCDGVVSPEDAEAVTKRASALLASVQALIGYYSLDATRVLDILLGVFATHIVHYHPLFIALLRQGPWDGTRIAQVLGAQWAHYSQPDVQEAPPRSLYLAAALLLRADLLAWRVLYPYMAPDDTIQRLHTAYEDALAAKQASVGANALTMAAPLVDDDAPSSASDKASSVSAAGTAAAARQAPPPSHAVMVVRALLQCGAYDMVMPFLAQYPWVFGAFPSVTQAYLRLVWHCLMPVWESMSLNVSTPKAPTEYALTLEAPELRGGSTAYVFCVGDWATHLTPVTDAVAILPMLAPLGEHVAQDARLLQRLCRCAAAASDTAVWLPFVRTQLLPAVCLAEGGAPLLYEAWSYLSKLSYPARYALYGEWKHRASKRPALRHSKAQTEREARGILRRVSADNVRASGRSLAKAAHANPLVFFDVVLHQIQSYDNLIEPVVDAAKYLTPLEYDVFSYALLEALSNPAKERTKSDGTNVSLWLKSLASFAGTFYRKYPSTDCTPVLQYLANRLKQDHVKDLVVLSELILKMAGMEPMGEMSESQVAALTGGPLMQVEATLTLIPATSPTAVLLARHSFKKNGGRLYRTLKESHLAVPLLLLMAQQWQLCVFHEHETHIKSLSSTFDTCASILLQYVHFLASQGWAEYASLVPTPIDCARRFGLSLPMAFLLTRPKLAWEVRHATCEPGKTESDAAAEAMEVDMGQPAEATDEEAEAMDTDDAPTWHPVLAPWMDEVESCLAPGSISALGVPFYLTFWQLSLADVTVPMERYQQEMTRLRQALQDLDAATDISDSLKKSAKMRLHETITQFTAELKEQTVAYQATRRRLANEKKHWFAPDVERGQLAQQFVAQCVHPRALQTPNDALFAARFVRMLHTIGTPHLPTLAVYDILLTQHVAPTLFSATENEARNYARFLHGLLSDLHTWLHDEAAYTKDAIGADHVGFALSWHGGRGMRSRSEDAPLSWRAFKYLALDWHHALLAAFQTCLTQEYMRMRNAIVVLNRMAAFFPLYKEHGQQLQEMVHTIATSDPRGDLKVLAHGLDATLRKQAASWVDVHFFRPYTREERHAQALQAKEERRQARRAARAARQQAEEERRAKERAEELARQKAEASREEARRAKAKAKEAQEASAKKGHAASKQASTKDEPRDARIRGSSQQPKGKDTRTDRPRNDARPAREPRGGDDRDEPERGRWGWGRERERDRERDRDRERWDRYDARRDRRGERERPDEPRRESNAMWPRRRNDTREPAPASSTPDEPPRGGASNARKRSLADRLIAEGKAADTAASSASDAGRSTNETDASPTQATAATPDAKRMRKDRAGNAPRQGGGGRANADDRPSSEAPARHGSWQPPQDRPHRHWGRDRNQDSGPREHRDRDRRKRRAGGD